MSGLPFGGTDCALPMLYASEKGLQVDAFVVMTDNETWAGNIHPVEALRDYRRKTGIPAKLVVVGMTSTGFSIADPERRRHARRRRLRRRRAGGDRRLPPLTAEEFVHAGEALFGKRWKAPLSRALDIDPVTIWRYATGQWPVPVVVELALETLKQRHKQRRRGYP